MLATPATACDRYVDDDPSSSTSMRSIIVNGSVLMSKKSLAVLSPTGAMPARRPLARVSVDA